MHNEVWGCAETLPNGALINLSKHKNEIVQSHDIGNTVWTSKALKSHLVIFNTETADSVEGAP